MKNTTKILTTIGLTAICSYIGSQMLADIGSLKIISLFGFIIDGGTFIYPITFTLRDLIHKQFGKKTAQSVILLAGAINVFMVLFFQFLIALPSDPSGFANAEFALVLGTVWRITLASIVAEVFSELIDTEAYHFFITKITKKHQWGRVLFSNAISVPVDSLIFGLIAFVGSLPMSIVWSIILSNIIVKGIITIVSLPLIYIVPEKKEE